jgi:hypothetical protein
MGEASELGRIMGEQGGWGLSAILMVVIWRLWVYITKLHTAIQKLGLESVKTMSEGNRTLDTVGDHVKKNSDSTEAMMAEVISIREGIKTVVDTTAKTSDRVAKLCGREEA